MCSSEGAAAEPTAGGEEGCRALKTMNKNGAYATLKKVGLL